MTNLLRGSKGPKYLMKLQQYLGPFLPIPKMELKPTVGRGCQGLLSGVCGNGHIVQHGLDLLAPGRDPLLHLRWRD